MAETCAILPELKHFLYTGKSDASDPAGKVLMAIILKSLTNVLFIIEV